MSYLQFFIVSSLILFTFSRAQSIIPVQDENKPILTFGSCNKFHKNPNPEIFHYITEQNSDVWVWAGDIVYLHQQDEKGVAQAFNNVKNAPLYTKLRTSTPVIGTWDDHDYGQNDGNRNYKYKERNKHIYLDFFDVPKDSPRRERDGVYEAYYLGNNKRVKIILLDVRYNRDGRLSFGSDMLGETQWNWLEQQLSDDPANFTLIVSGSQVLPDDRIFPEHWFDSSRQRLIGLIQKFQVSGVMLLSGDVHYAEIMKHPCPQRVGYNLYEFTSSGLTHFVSEYIPYGGHLFNELFPFTFNEPKDRFMEKNFGTIRFSFEREEPTVVLETRNDHGTIVLSKEISYSELRFNQSIIDFNATCVLDKNRFRRLIYKYLVEIVQKNRFMINYTIVVGLILLGLFGILVVLWSQRRKVLGKCKAVWQKICKRSSKQKLT